MLMSNFESLKYEPQIPKSQLFVGIPWIFRLPVAFVKALAKLTADNAAHAE